MCRLLCRLSSISEAGRSGGDGRKLLSDAMRTLWALVLVVASAGCASDRQSVPVISEPSGATALAENQRIKTPGSILVPDGAQELEIRIELEGYEPQTVLLTQSDSSDFANCLENASSEPSGGGSRGGTRVARGGGIAIIRIARARPKGCSPGTDLLVPTFVMVKLAPRDPPPIPVRGTLALR